MITFKTFTEKVDPALIKKINARASELFWKNLLAHMDKLVKKGGTRHSLGTYAADTLRVFNVPGMKAKDVALKYQEMYESTHPLTDADLEILRENAIGAPANSVSAKGVSMAPSAGKKHGIIVMDRRLRKSARLLKKYRIPT